MDDSNEKKSLINISISPSEAIELLSQENSFNLILWQNKAQNIVKNYFNERISYTTNLFLPVTFLCRNTCTYCNYKKKKTLTGEEFISKENVSQILTKGINADVSEIMITTGEKPELIYPSAEKWLSEHKFGSTIEYIHFIAELALSKGLLPHINAGTLNSAELSYLKPVSASMGMMLENISSRFQLEGMAHNKSPDKDPKKRFQTLIAAGKLKIPFTTGLLIGIGETPKEIVASLFSIKKLEEKYGHIQEVIIQHNTSVTNQNDKSPVEKAGLYLKKVLIAARNILPPSISLQTPPNLISGMESDIIKAGISDWGGISPVSIDYINPKEKWPTITELKQITNKSGFSLIERLPIYPQYIKVPWLNPSVYNTMKKYELITAEGYRKR